MLLVTKPVSSLNVIFSDENKSSIKGKQWPFVLLFATNPISSLKAYNNEEIKSSLKIRYIYITLQLLFFHIRPSSPHTLLSSHQPIKPIRPSLRRFSFRLQRFRCRQRFSFRLRRFRCWQCFSKTIQTPTMLQRNDLDASVALASDCDASDVDDASARQFRRRQRFSETIQMLKSLQFPIIDDTSSIALSRDALVSDASGFFFFFLLS